MINRIRARIRADRLSVFTALALVCLVARAGDLNPPAGPIAPTDRVTLNEQAISLPYTISQPGSYVLTSDLTGVAGQPGIIIAANDVTLDLNGFALRGVAGSLEGVRPAEGNWTNITIRNGVVSDWGAGGIESFIFSFPSDGRLQRTRYESITATDNGGTGLAGGVNAIMVGCISRQNAGVGFALSNQGGVLRDCVSASNDDDGVAGGDGVLIEDCTILGNGGDGVELVNSEHEIRSSVISDNTGVGIRAFGAALIHDCQIEGNGAGGVIIFFGCQVLHNNIRGNGAFGLSGLNVSPSGRNHIESNSITFNSGFGITMTSNTGNVIVRNIVLANTGGGISAAGSSAPTSADPATAGPWANIVQP